VRLASRLRTGSLYVYFLCLEAGHGVSLAWGSDSGRKGDGMACRSHGAQIAEEKEMV